MGKQKMGARLDLEKDSGILYHSIGEYGVDYWKAWALSQEFQIIEGGMGDFWCIASSKIDIPASKPSDNGDYIYTSGGKMVTFGPGNGFCRRKYAPKLEKEGWNTLELICYGDKSLHLVNGEVVMALTNSRYTQNGREIPLTKGRLQLQSEAAEVFFKDIKIKNINRMPAQYRSYFK